MVQRPSGQARTPNLHGFGRRHLRRRRSPMLEVLSSHAAQGGRTHRVRYQSTESRRDRRGVPALPLSTFNI